MRVGLFGGSFNPVHTGHLVVAQDAAEAFDLDRVVFVPCGNPPHKPSGELAAGEHRAAMIEAAIEGDPRFALSRCELERPGMTYTIDTVRAMRAARPDDSLHFLIGADTLTELHSWKEIGALLGLCEFLTLVRPGFDPARIDPASFGLPGPWPARLLGRTARVHEIGISSRDIRMRLAEGLGIRYLVPDCVERYIGEHHLYGV
jgi:nicotinate-nucleotide adenylyltransferase